MDIMIRRKFKALRDILLKKEYLDEFNMRYRQGPDLYFYKRVLKVNFAAKSIDAFLDNNYYLELLYATLVSWDMNSRGAKLEYFDKFKESILSQKNKLKHLWRKSITTLTDIDQTISIVGDIYDNLHLMKSQSRLVSNSKALHYILPELLMPMDGQNTLMYFYNNTSESRNKYLNIIKGSFEFIDGMKNTKFYLDNEWNRTIPKTIDNAILIKQGVSLK